MVRFAFSSPTAALAFALLGHGKHHLIMQPQQCLQPRRGNVHTKRPYYSHSNTVSPYACASPPVTEKHSMAAHDKLSNDTHSAEEQQGAAVSLHDLCMFLEASPTDLLRLETSKTDGVRGIFTNFKILAGDIVLRVPLRSCLLDDKPPNWYVKSLVEREDGKKFAYQNPSEWATRLAASVVDLQMEQRLKREDQHDKTSRNLDTGKDLWLSLLPNLDYLRASLPVHWSEQVLQSARCTALELAVDSSYFARAEAVADLMIALERHHAQAKGIPKEELTQLCHDALDVVQTRSCRADRVVMGDVFPLRILAPIFDLINHGSSSGRGEGSANARFGVEDHEDDKGVSHPYLCVRATRDIDDNEEVLFNYGPSAKPSWKCLLNYGFVPRHIQSEHCGDDGDCVAEVFLDGNRYEVGPANIPFELVEAASPPELLRHGEDITLTSAIALKLAKRISTVSYYLLVDDKRRLQNNENNGYEDFLCLDDELDFIESTEDLLSWQLAASLRWSQHRILCDCAKGLQAWANGE